VTFAQTTLRNNRLMPSYIIVAALLIVLIVTGGIVSDRFLTWRNGSNLVQQMAVLGLASLGQTFVILLGGIDLSIGALVSATTVFLANFLEWRPDLVWLAVPLALALAAAVGALNGYFSIRLRVHPLIVTLGMSSIIFGASLSYRREPGGSIPPGFDTLAFGTLWGVPIPAIALLGAFVIAGIWLQRSRSGRSLYFVGGGFENARLNGLPVVRITVAVYALSGFCAGLAAIFLLAKTGVGIRGSVRH
jgi:ribose transport system permease protein